MSTEKTSLIDGSTAAAAADVSNISGWILAAGIINVIFGIFALGSPWIATSVILSVISVSLVMAGVVTMTGVCYAEVGMRTQLFLYGAGKFILGFALGYFKWTHPTQTIEVITIAMAIVFLLHGVSSCVVAFQNRDYPTWGWTLINGVCAIAFSIAVMSVFPWSSYYTLGVLVGVNLVCHGICRIAIALLSQQAALEVIEAEPSSGETA